CFPDRIRPICILMNGAASVLKDINTFSAFGWGTTSMSGRPSQMLKTIQMRRRPSRKCQYDGIQLTNGQFCADSAMGPEPCTGDSGGPVVANVRNRTVQMGIISYGSIDCDAPGVYTDVASYTNWIASYVQQ
ncbi:hypothetical protein KR200_008349, partial [Drosophila serrata]